MDHHHIYILYVQSRNGFMISYVYILALPGGCWTRDSMVVGSIPIPGMVHFLSLGNFIDPDLPQYTQLQMSTNIVGKVPAMD